MTEPRPFDEYEIAYTLEDVRFETHSEDLKDDLDVIELDYLKCAGTPRVDVGERQERAYARIWVLPSDARLR
jgi:predicted metallopeptidase